MRWDPDKPHILYASSEPGDDGFDGIHKAFDLNEGRRSGFTFHVDEAGDAMAVSLGEYSVVFEGFSCLITWSQEFWLWLQEEREEILYAYSTLKGSASTAPRKLSWNLPQRVLQILRFLA
jgi:hypothetical protein